MQRHPTASATRSAILKASEMRACPRPFPENRRSTARRASKISGKSYGGSPCTYFFGKASRGTPAVARVKRSEEHTSELQSQSNLVCRLLLEKKKKQSHRSSQL